VLVTWLCVYHWLLCRHGYRCWRMVSKWIWFIIKITRVIICMVFWLPCLGLEHSASILASATSILPRPRPRSRSRSRENCLTHIPGINWDKLGRRIFASPYADYTSCGRTHGGDSVGHGIDLSDSATSGLTTAASLQLAFQSAASIHNHHVHHHHTNTSLEDIAQVSYAQESVTRPSELFQPIAFRAWYGYNFDYLFIYLFVHLTILVRNTNNVTTRYVNKTNYK